MRFGSICSGIEAASSAWLPLGWQCAFTAEIEPFPCAVLKHHYPDTPNYGDLTKYRDWPAERIDILIGGTPCQSFSVAGLRKGMADPRGNLALTFLGCVERFAPAWVVWENVPGVLSVDGGRAFGSFLGGLAGIGYGFAYRVLDAQYFGLAQRRKRVFVVGHSGGQWQRAAAVLFDRESLLRNPAPRRTAGQGATYSVAPSIGASGRGFERAGETRGQDCVIPINMQAAAKNGAKSPNMLGIGQPGDPAMTLGANDRHAVGVPVCIGFDSKQGGDTQLGYSENHCPPVHGDARQAVAHTLRGNGFDASEDGTGRGTPIVIAHGQGNAEMVRDGSPSLTCNHEAPIVFDTTQVTSNGNYSNPKHGDACHPLAEGAHAPAVAFTQNQCGDVLTGSVAASIGTNQNATGRNTAKVLTRMAVRRLTPKECEILQGFSPGYTDVPYRNKPACDGPRYKALGNSMAVPVIRWIGERIELVESL